MRDAKDVCSSCDMLSVKIMKVDEAGRIVSFAKVVDEEHQGRPGEEADAAVSADAGSDEEDTE